MEKQIGFIVRDDATTNQTTVECQGLSAFLNRNSVTDPYRLKRDAQSMIMEGSSNHSYLFMDYNFSACMAPQARALRKAKKLTERMPVYGVKAQVPDSKRGSNYGELLFCEENDLLGEGFIHNVFGARYLTGEESVRLTDSRLREIIEKAPGLQECKIQDVVGICSVLEQLCNTLANNPEARFIVLLDDADNCSMNLLRQLYCMLPHRIRLQLGFETNVLKSDIDVVIKKGWPIHLFTAEKSTFSKLESEKTQIVICDYDRCRTEGMINPSKRLQKLIELAEHMSPEWITYLSYTERKLLEQKSSAASSFTYYFEIIDAVFDPSLYWWSNERIESIEGLKEAFEDQRELMNNQQIHMQSMDAFVSGIMPKNYFAEQLVEKASSEDSAAHEGLMQFLRENLGFSSMITAIGTFAANMRRDKRDAVENLHREEDAKRQAELKYAEEMRLRDLKEAEEKRTRDLEDAEERRIRDLKEAEAEYEAATKEASDAFHKEKDYFEKVIVEQKGKIAGLQETETRQSRDIASKDALLRKREEEVRNQQDMIRELQNILEDSEDYELQLKYKRQKTVAAAASVVLALVAAAGITAGFFFNPLMKKQKIVMEGKLESEKDSYESEKAVLESEKADAESEKAVLESEKAVLESEKTAIEAERDVLKEELKKKADTAPTKPAVPPNEAQPVRDENGSYNAKYKDKTYILY